MRRRDFVRACALLGATTAIAGCNTTTSSTESTETTESDLPAGTEPDDPSEQTRGGTEIANRYVFEDETGTLGHLGDDTIPDDHDHVITNTLTESEYDELQRNDRDYAEDAVSSDRAPQGEGLEMTVDEMIDRTEEIYNDPVEHIEPCSCYDDLDLTAEDDEIVFTRALIKAAQEAGTDSSGLADIVTANMAEDAVDQIQPGFTDYKLSTIRATEPIAPGKTGATGGAKRTNDWDQTFVSSGFRHLPGILQYEKDGETKVKYAELTDATNVDIFRRVIRDPEFSAYRSSLDQDTISVSRDSEPGDSGSSFPEHYVTAFDYEKARELESQGILGLGKNKAGGFNAVGDSIGIVLFDLVDDMSITGYDTNPDRSLHDAQAVIDGTLVSDSFGRSIENYITDPTTQKRQYIENVARGMFQIQQQEGWGTSFALTGTLEDPEIIPTDQNIINQVRKDEAYDEVRERATWFT